jgi:hypothetical protein
MTGEEHYREAERLLDIAENNILDDEPDQIAVTARAQVHATLALAAAQSHVPAQHGYPARERYGADDR